MKILRAFLVTFTLYFLIALAAALFLARPSEAQKYGGDYLAAVRYESEMMAAHPRGGVGGIFLRTFGDARRTVERMAASGKFSEIVVHAAAFDNSHAYPIDKLLPQLRVDAAWAEGVAKANPGTVIMFSPFCEHNHKAVPMLLVFRELGRIAPSVVMVNSIWKGERIPGITTEIHLVSSKNLPPIQPGDTVSADGFGGDGSGDWPDADVPAILAKYKAARHIRFWNFRLNCKFGHNDTTPIKDRKACPSVEYLIGHLWQMRDRQCPKAWPNTQLAKPFADDHGNVEPTKDNKLMAILPPQGGSVNVYDAKGGVVDTMRRAPTDHTGKPKGARYYSAKHAYQVGDLAQKATGSRCVRIGKSPLTDVDFRSGLFR